MRIRNLWQIAQREISARRVLVPAAVVLGALAMMAIRSLDHGSGDADGIMNGTWIATLVISAIVGMSLLGDELANGRVSFYFVRPFAPSEIYGGKLLAGILLALVIQAAVIALVGVGLPALAWQDSQLAERGIGAIVGERILGTFACVTFGIAISIALQSRTRWVVLDVICAILVGVVCTFTVVHVRRTMDFGHHGDPGVPVDYDSNVVLLQLAALAVAVIALAFATSRAMMAGRTDRERTHAALSKALWPIVVPAAALLLAATSAWY